MRRRTRPLPCIGGTLIALVAVLMTACGGESPESGGTTGQKTFVLGLTTSVPPDLDIAPFGSSDRTFFATTSSKLWTPDVDSCNRITPAADYVGNLVDTWDVSEDGKQIKATLKSNISSPYGNPITSEDVKWSVERLFSESPEVTNAVLVDSDAHFKPKNTVEIVDDKTFILHVDRPTPTQIVAWNSAFPMFDSTEAKKHATADDPWASKWMKTNWGVVSPWKLEEFRPDDQVIFTQNPGWKAPRGNITRLIVKTLSDASVGFQAIQSGDMDYVTGLSYQQYGDLKEKEGVEVHSCPSGGDVLILNQAFKPFSDVKVRQAISEALDRQELADGALSGLGDPSKYALPESVIPEGADVKEAVQDVEHAKQLLAEAGHPDGFDFTLTISPKNKGEQNEQEAVLMKDQLSAIGINMEIKVIASAAEYEDTDFGGKYQAILDNRDAPGGDPYLYYANFTPGQPNASFHWDDPQFFKTLEHASTLSPGTKEYKDATVKIANEALDAYAVIPLVATPFVFATRAGTTDFAPVSNEAISPVNVKAK